MGAFLHRLGKDASGATAVEYALIAALIALGAMSAITGFGASLAALWSTLAAAVNTAIGI